RFGGDAYRRFIQMFGRIVMGIDGAKFDEALEAAKHSRGAEQDTDLDAAALREVADEFKAIVRRETDRDFPSDPDEQLDLAIKAVFASWFGKRERHYRDVQDLEFTIERGRLYMLQTRAAKRTAAAAVRIAVDMVEAGIITKEGALGRIEPAHVDQLLRDQFDPAARAAAQRIANGLNASPGAAVGKAVFSADTAVEWAGRGERVVLVRIETSPDDFHGMAVAQGILTARGGATSHAAVVARQIGKPCVAGVHELQVNYANGSATANGVTFKEGDPISLDGSTGEVF